MKKMKKVMIAMVAMLGCMALGGCGSKKVNLNDYVTVKISGIDTKGHAEVEVDEESLEEDMAKLLGLHVDEEDISNFEELGMAFDKMEKLQTAIDCVEFEAEPTENLKNGDTVVVKASVDEKTAKELGVKLSFKEIRKKVEGLQNAVTVSQDELFRDIVVEFTGVSPNAQVQIRNTSKDEVISQIQFTADKIDGVRKGDRIVVTAVNAEDFEKEGYLFSEPEKEYIAEEVDCYITGFEQFTEAGLQKIMKQAKDMAATQLVTKKADASFYRGDEYISQIDSADTISEPELQTSYFYFLKEGTYPGYGEAYNALGITYKFDATDMGGGMFEKEAADYQDCYILIWCCNLILDKNGEVQFDVNTMRFSDAYSSVDTFLMKEVDSSRDRYEIQEAELANY